MIYTTLNRIREHKPCASDWKKLLKYLGKTKPDDEPLSYAVIAESNGLDSVVWCSCAEARSAFVAALWIILRGVAIDTANAAVRDMPADVARDEAWDVAYKSARDAQIAKFLRLLEDAA
jgi:hypothetical protein